MVPMQSTLKALCPLLLLILLHLLPATLAAANLPGKIYGVDLGSWLVLEPWMLPQEWQAMGGESCDPCSACIASEFAFAKAYPDTVDEKFDEHWSSWFTQGDVDKIASYGMNTVRIPLGYWIVEPLVDRKTEFYPRGGIKQLKRGLRQLKAAGIKAILGQQGAPGGQSPNQMFTGKLVQTLLYIHCTSEVHFYTPYNYHRALIWSAVMTALSHLDPDFGSVFSIEAVNEPIMDATQTPGYGDFQKNFVKVVRAVETVLGIGDSGKSMVDDLLDNVITKRSNVTESLLGGENFGGEVGRVLVDAAPILAEVLGQLGLGSIIGDVIESHLPSRTPLATMFMDINWQFNNPPNPAEAAKGPQIYDNHLYYSFGGVADPNEDAYLTSICNLQRVQNDAALGNSPLLFGEWSLATQFDPSDSFLMKWADAQKIAYSQGAGWIFWSFKMGKSDSPDGPSRVWSYFEGVDRGYLTKDPTKLLDPHVCDDFISTPNSTSSSTSAGLGR